jgi:gas vesicle protein
MRKIFGFLTGALIGGLVGSALALLFTPASGNELRDQLQERVSHIQAELKEAASARREELENQLIKLRAPRQPE